MAAIFNLLLTPMSEIVHTSSAVLADLENVCAAFGILLITNREAELLRYFICTSGNAAFFDSPLTSMSDNVHRSPTELVDPKIVRVALVSSLQSSIEEEILRYFIRTSGNGGHLRFTTYPAVGQCSH